MKTILLMSVLSLSTLQTACSTLDEVIHEPNAPSYQTLTDSQGHKKEIRVRIIEPGAPKYSPFLPATRSLLSSEPTSVGNGGGKSYSAIPTPLRVAEQVVHTKYVDANTPTDQGISLVSVSNFHATNLDLIYEKTHRYWDYNLGVSLLDSDHTYLGFTGGARIHMPWRLSPFAGLGIYAGDSKTCSYTDLGGGYSEETCEKYFLTALTLDYGLQMKFNDHFQLRAFARNFSQTEQGDPRTQTLYGVGLSLLF
jgi:hypothetical protein